LLAGLNLADTSFYRQFPALAANGDADAAGLPDLRESVALSAPLAATLAAMQADTTRAQFMGRIDTH